MAIECLEYKTDNMPSLPGAKSQSLNPNHSHFLLIDDAKLNVFGGEIDSRSRIEKVLYTGNEQRQPIPVIVVCIEGGPNTVWHVLKSVQNEIPCLFVDVILIIYKFVKFNKLKLIFRSIELRSIFRYILFHL